MSVIAILKEEVRNVPQKEISATPYLKREDENLFKNRIGVSRLVLKEVAYVRGKIKMFRRVYVCEDNSIDYSQVGWVLNHDMDACMICGVNFILFGRHHCRACGDLVCKNCSSDTAYLSEFMSWGPLRVCRMCHFGQDEISVNPLTTKKIELMSKILGDDNNSSALISNLSNPEDILHTTQADGTQHVTVDLQSGSRKPTIAELKLLSAMSVFDDGGSDRLSGPMASYDHNSGGESDDVTDLERGENMGSEDDIVSGDGLKNTNSSNFGEDSVSEASIAPLTFSALQALQEQLQDENNMKDEDST